LRLHTPSPLLAPLIGAWVTALAFLAGGLAVSTSSAAGQRALAIGAQEIRQDDERRFCSRESTRNCGLISFAAQKVRSPFSFGLNVHLESDKMPVAIIVALPRGSRFTTGGATCSREQAPNCPKGSQVGGGLAYPWHIQNSGISFDCYAEGPGAVRVFNAGSWNGYIARMKFHGGPAGEAGCVLCPPGCSVLLRGEYKRNVLTIHLPNWEQWWKEDVPDQPPVQATMSNFGMSFIGKTKAGVPLLRTPRRCDRDRGWKSVVKVKFDDGSTKRFAPGRHQCHR
jgi:hypothetical protein